MPRRLPRGSESELRIQRVAQPVAQQVDAERRQRERRAGERGQPPRDVEKIAALRQHAAPRGRGRLDAEAEEADRGLDRKSTRLNSSHSQISYAVFCLKKKKNNTNLLASIFSISEVHIRVR